MNASIATAVVALLVALASPTRALALFTSGTDVPPSTPPPCTQRHADAAAIRKAEPEYPDRARQQSASGSVTIKVTLSRTGTVAAASVYRSSGFPSLDEAALKAALATTYSPEIEDCQAVSGNYLFVVRYTFIDRTCVSEAAQDVASTYNLLRKVNDVIGIHFCDLAAVNTDKTDSSATVPPGVGIDAVARTSPAYLSGIRTGDVVTELDGRVYWSAEDLNHYLDTKKQGDTIRLIRWRNGIRSPITFSL